MIIIPLSIELHYCLTKNPDLTFIGCHNVRLQYCWMVVTTSVRAPSWHGDVPVCALTRFVPYPLHKFRLKSSFSYMWLCHISVLTSWHVLSTDYVRVRIVFALYWLRGNWRPQRPASFETKVVHKFRLTSSFSYLWLWRLSVLTSCHILSADYVHVRLVHFFSFFLRLHAVGTFFRTIFLYLHVVSYPVSFCLHDGFNSFSSCLHVGINFFFFLPNLNHISNMLLVWEWSHLKGIHVFPSNYHVTKFREYGSL